MFPQQRNLKDNVCNYILKYVTDNNQSRDQGVSKVQEPSILELLALEGNSDAPSPKPVDLTDKEMFSQRLVTCPQSLNN